MSRRTDPRPPAGYLFRAVLCAVLGSIPGIPIAASAPEGDGPASAQPVSVSGRVCVGYDKGIWVWTEESAKRARPGCDQPIEGAEVLLVSADGPTAKARTAQDGTFELDAVPLAGRTDDRFEVSAAGYPSIRSRGVGQPGGFLGAPKNDLIVFLPGVVDPWWKKNARPDE